MKLAAILISTLVLSGLVAAGCSVQPMHDPNATGVVLWSEQFVDIGNILANFVHSVWIIPVAVFFILGCINMAIIYDRIHRKKLTYKREKAKQFISTLLIPTLALGTFGALAGAFNDPVTSGLMSLLYTMATFLCTVPEVYQLVDVYEGKDKDVIDVTNQNSPVHEALVAQP